MKYTIGDTVRFKVGPGEIQKGNVRFIDIDKNENIFYVNGFGGWAYKIPEKNVLSRLPKNTPSRNIGRIRSHR
ncbi:MAG: hypothetical protein ACNA7I_05635 [Candidatus Methanoperedens sp.]